MLNRYSHRLPKASLRTLATIGLAAAWTGGALAPPAQAQAADNAKLNPCPSVYYEAPLNERFLSPEGCPPNAARQAERTPSRSSATPGSGAGSAADGTAVETIVETTTVETTTAFPPTPVDSTVQPLPEELGPAIAQVTPQNQQVNVTLTNDTQAAITYEVIGQTDRRTLNGRDTVVLRGLALPTTISTVRNDSGLLNFNTAIDEAGQLQVTLDENPQFNEVQGVLQIQEDGEVFLN